MFTDSRFVRRLAAILVALAGVMNIVSALYPAIPSRLHELGDILPFVIIRDTQNVTVLTGFLLILLADGLRQRRRRAWQLTVALLMISSLLNLAKGLDYEEAAISLGVTGFLLAISSAFTIPGRLPAPRHVVKQSWLALVVYAGYITAGFAILRRAIRPAPHLLNVLLEPFRLVVGTPFFTYHSAQARWFEGSLTVVTYALVMYGVAQILRPLLPLPLPTAGERARVRGLIERYGDDTLSYFALQDGRSYFFDVGGEAFLSYRLWGNVALVGGDPIGPSHRFPALIQSFLEFTEANGMAPCLLGVSGRHLHLYRSLGMRTLKIGEEALIDLPAFDGLALKKKVRRAVRHVEEMGISVATYRRDQLPEDVLHQIEVISQSWVEVKGGAERGFSMTLGRLPRLSDADCEVTVAMRGDEVFGYLAMVPVYGSAGWSLDAMRRREDSPNGLMECLVVRAAEMYRDRGCRTLSLNFASLSNSENDIDSRALEGVRRFLFENLSSLYQLKTLYQFNSKFAPVWRSRHVAYCDVLQVPKLALAIVQSEDPVRLPRLTTVFRRQ